MMQDWPRYFAYIAHLFRDVQAWDVLFQWAGIFAVFTLLGFSI